MGWVLSTYRDTPAVGHAGGIDGFSCFYARFPEHDADEDDPDIRLRAHGPGVRSAAVTIDYPFTWFTGYRSADEP
jgi:hypothetical protein